jgi:hypothetical protein
MVSDGTGNSGFDEYQQWPVILATSHKDFHIQLQLVSIFTIITADTQIKQRPVNHHTYVLNRSTTKPQSEIYKLDVEKRYTPKRK